MKEKNERLTGGGRDKELLGEELKHADRFINTPPPDTLRVSVTHKHWYRRRRCPGRRLVAGLPRRYGSLRTVNTRARRRAEPSFDAPAAAALNVTSIHILQYHEGESDGVCRGRGGRWLRVCFQ